MTGHSALPARVSDLGDGLDRLARAAAGYDELTAARIRDTLIHEIAPNTRRAMNKAVNYYRAWLRARYGAAAAAAYPPAKASELIAFITDHAYGPPAAVDEALVSRVGRPAGERPPKAKFGAWSYATIRQRLELLGMAHRRVGMMAPLDIPEVKHFLKASRRAMARDPAREDKLGRRTRAVSAEVLFEVVARLQAEARVSDQSLALRATRDLAIILVGFGAGGRRRSELAVITCRDLEPATTPAGESTYRLLVRRSKTDQVGQGRAVVIPPLAAQALDRWRASAGVDQGPLFRRFSPRGSVLQYPLSGDGLYRIIKGRFAEVGANYSPHSLRAGFVTEALRQKRGTAETMAMTGHKSLSTFMGYYDEALSGANESVGVLEEAQRRVADSDC